MRRMKRMIADSFIFKNKAAEASNKLGPYTLGNQGYDPP
jgi:hypothetical protein